MPQHDAVCSRVPNAYTATEAFMVAVAWSVGLNHPDGAGDPRPAETAVSVRDLVQVLLVVVLGVVKRAGLACGASVCGDRAELELVEQRLVRGLRRLVGLALLIGRPVNGRPVLGTDVVALPVALRRVV